MQVNQADDVMITVLGIAILNTIYTKNIFYVVVGAYRHLVQITVFSVMKCNIMDYSRQERRL